MVEFTDLQCPFCRQYVSTSFDEIKKNWIDTGKLRYISRDFPLDFHRAGDAGRARRALRRRAGQVLGDALALMRNAQPAHADYITKTAAI
jgi:protein-disulfide isomerase